MNMLPQAPLAADAPGHADQDPMASPVSRRTGPVAAPVEEVAERTPAAEPVGSPIRPGPRRRWAVLAGSALAVAAMLGAAWLARGWMPREEASAPATPLQGASTPGGLHMTPAEMRAVRIEPVSLHVFRTERIADGRIAQNEDRATPVVTPYSGRVVKVHARVGDTVAAGDTLFEIETTDLATAAGDLLSAADSARKAIVALDQARREETRQNSLFAARAAAQRDVEQARLAVAVAAADLRSAQASLAAARDKLRVLGRASDEIQQIEETRRVDAVVPVTAPIGGTVTQRRVGPGQWLSTGAGTDPVFTIADLSTVWLVAAVRELDAPLMRVGQAASVTVTALPDQQFEARITMVGTALDPITRRLPVRAEVRDPDRLLKPEMFALFRIVVGAPREAVGVPVNAVILRGSEASVWVATGGNDFALRPIRPGVRMGDMIEVREGLAAGERVVSGGALFIDRAARID